MARRRRPPEPASPEALPERLAVCLVEDWVGAGDQPVLTDGDRTFGLLLLARRRWWTAREAWAEEHGLSRRDVTARYGVAAPRWRTPPPS